jgi:hypothetical protein
MKTWPTKLQRTNYNYNYGFLVTAQLLTLIAVLDGIVMLLIFKPFFVLCEIGMASCAIIVWCLYFNTKTLIDVKDLPANQQSSEN